MLTHARSTQGLLLGERIGSREEASSCDKRVESERAISLGFFFLELSGLLLLNSVIARRGKLT